jgi:outer membrane protein insertion porin family
MPRRWTAHNFSNSFQNLIGGPGRGKRRMTGKLGKPLTTGLALVCIWLGSFQAPHVAGAQPAGRAEPPRLTADAPTLPAPSASDPAADGPIVVDVKVLGARRFPEAGVLNDLRTRKGKPLSRQALLDDTRRLDATQRYVIGVTSEIIPHAEGVIVKFCVVERAVIHEIKYVGFKHLSRDEREQATGLRKGMPLSVALNRRAAQSLERAYQAKGYLFAQVFLVEGDKDDDLNVVFQATEGPVVKIRDIRCEGQSFVSGARLKTKIDSESRWFGAIGGEYNPQMLDRDVAKLLEFYRSFGFFDVKIRREVRWNPGFKTVDVVFVIDEGQRFIVKDVQVVGNQRVDSDVLMARNVVKPGEPFKGSLVQASARLMSDEYGSRGEINSRVTPAFDFQEDAAEVTVRYQVQEGQPAKVGEIKIVGNTTTEDHVIRRQLLIYPGQVLSLPAIRASEANLRRLGIFKVAPEEGVAPTITVLDPDGPSPVKDVLVEVQEDRTGSINFGAGINSDSGATLQIVLNERNFDICRPPTSVEDFLSGQAWRGAGQEFRMEAVPGTVFNRYSVSWREPYLFDSPYSLSTQAYFMTRAFNEYTDQRTGGRLEVRHRFTPLWSAGVGLRIEDINVSNVPFNAPVDYTSIIGNNFVVGPRVNVSRDSRDSFLRPTTGNNLEIAYEQVFGDFTYPLVTVEDSHFFTVYERPDGSGRHVFMLRGMVGFAGSHTPAYDRFFAGGNHTIRGFDFRGVGPTVNGYKVGGDFLAVGTVEYQIPLMANDKVFAVIFSDFGTCEEDVRIGAFRVTLGAGLRLVVPMFGPLPIALDWAVPLNQDPNDIRRVFSFYVGFTR